MWITGKSHVHVIIPNLILKPWKCKEHLVIVIYKGGATVKVDKVSILEITHYFFEWVRWTELVQKPEFGE